MKYRFIAFFIFSIHTIITTAQNYPQLALNYLNAQSTQPAMAGSVNNAAIISTHLRFQWVGIIGAPATQYLSMHMPIMPLRTGLGLNLYNDVLGLHRYSNMSIDISYYVSLSKNSKISLGIRNHIGQFALRGDKIITPEGNYENIVNHADNLLPITMSHGMNYDISAGISYLNPTMYISLAAQNIFESISRIDGVNGSILYAQDRTIQLLANKNIDFNKKWGMNINLSFLTNLDVHQTFFNINCVFQHNIWLGAAFRGYNSKTIDAMSPSLGMKIGDKYTIAYTYEVGLSSLKSVHKGTHELFLNFQIHNIFVNKPPKVINNPRII